MSGGTSPRVLECGTAFSGATKIFYGEPRCELQLTLCWKSAAGAKFCVFITELSKCYNFIEKVSLCLVPSDISHLVLVPVQMKMVPLHPRRESLRLQVIELSKLPSVQTQVLLMTVSCSCIKLYFKLVLLLSSHEWG